jgi:predicted AAA+ superfamily ATPase
MKSSIIDTEMYKRSLNLAKAVELKSFFLFGPRQVGKSTWIQQSLPDALHLKLLQSEVFRALSSNPERLRERVASQRSQIVVIDEIQKLPSLLDEVQLLIDSNKSLRFILTGSSSRKLKRAGVNLLGGRARRLALYPLTVPEFLSDSRGRDPLSTMLQWGGLPSVLNSAQPRVELEDYIGTYLREEIQAEAIVRSIEGFSRFLNTAALSNAEQVIFSEVASDAEVPARTVREYFQVLEDTLVGRLLPAFQETKKRKAMASAKFYFFDVGIANALLGRWELRPGTPEYGKALEHLVWRELESSISYLGAGVELTYWRSLSKFEVDFVLQKSGEKTPFLAVEVKAKPTTALRDVRGLRAFAEEFPKIRKIVVSLEPNRRSLEDGTEIWPANDFFNALWNGELF